MPLALNLTGTPICMPRAGGRGRGLPPGGGGAVRPECGRQHRTHAAPPGPPSVPSNRCDSGTDATPPYHPRPPRADPLRWGNWALGRRGSFGGAEEGRKTTAAPRLRRSLPRRWLRRPYSGGGVPAMVVLKAMRDLFLEDINEVGYTSPRGTRGAGGG